MGKQLKQRSATIDVMEMTESNDGTLYHNEKSLAALAKPEEFLDDKDKIKTHTHVREKPKRTTKKHSPGCAGKSRSCLKNCCFYFFSYVGLISLVVAYSVLGGFVFLELERYNEEQVQEKVVELRTRFARRIEDNYKTECSGSCSTTEWQSCLYNTTDKLERLLKQFQNETYFFASREGWAGIDVGGENKWTFAGALLFSVTVITTIGYGYAAPKTTVGRAVTMVYALIGIPLTVLCITKIGKAMASLVRALYNRTVCVECRQQFFQSNKRNSKDTVQDLSEMPDEQPHEHEHDDVPMFICICLVIWYIAFGSIMFTIWEDWSYFTGAYFCFITLSTIGFGDVVPGFSHKDWDDQVKQVACSIYLLLGLSILAMCFDLMQQNVVRIANRLGKCTGIVKLDK